MMSIESPNMEIQYVCLCRCGRSVRLLGVETVKQVDHEGPNASVVPPAGWQ